MTLNEWLEGSLMLRMLVPVAEHISYRSSTQGFSCPLITPLSILGSEMTVVFCSGSRYFSHNLGKVAHVFNRVIESLDRESQSLVLFAFSGLLRFAYHPTI